TLSLTLEALQLMLPERTPSLADFIAEQTGAAIGAAFWLTGGDAIACQVSEWMHARRRRLAWAPALVVYTAVWAGAKLFPFDATLDVHQLAQRVHNGRILLTPFAGGAGLPRLIAEALAAAPIALLGPVGAAAIVVVGAGQGIVDSRSGDITIWL